MKPLHKGLEMKSELIEDSIFFNCKPLYTKKQFIKEFLNDEEYSQSSIDSIISGLPKKKIGRLIMIDFKAMIEMPSENDKLKIKLKKLGL